VDGSLDELTKAFESWRTEKRHAREAVPRELLERARRAMSIHGPGPVARAVKLERARLLRGIDRGGKGTRSESRPAPAVVPAFSRLAVAAPASASNRPFAEIETPSGLKLRVFADTREAIALLSSLCGAGGGR
jgi:hypothetical protein